MLADDAGIDADALERASAASIRLRDVLWAIRRDRLRTAREVDALAGRDASASGPGRLPGDPAGVVGDRPHGGARARLGRPPRLRVEPRPRRRRPGDRRGDRRAVARSAVPGRLGAARRRAGRRRHACSRSCTRRPPRSASSATTRRRCAPQVAGDDLLRLAMSGERGRGLRARPHAVGERRHHLGAQRPPGEQRRARAVRRRAPGPYVVGVLNGDVDNHADLKAANGLRIAGPITTDAKVIPALVARNCARHRRRSGRPRRGVPPRRRRLRGLGRHRGRRARHGPDVVMLALRGSGQGIYVGIADDRYVVASEPYGIVEETDRYVRLDGEHGGQLVALDGAAGRDARRDRPLPLRRLAGAGHRRRRRRSPR